MPMAMAIGRPIADHSEKRPPTQSQNSNMFAASMPNAVTSSVLVDSATKCLATAPSPSASTSQARADLALVSVSWVVNVFEATMNRVVSGSSRFTVSAMWVPSTLETKWTPSPGC